MRLLRNLATLIPPTDTLPLVGFSSRYNNLIKVLLPLAVLPITKTKSFFLIFGVLGESFLKSNTLK